MNEMVADSVMTNDVILTTSDVISAANDVMLTTSDVISTTNGVTKLNRDITSHTYSHLLSPSEYRESDNKTFRLVIPGKDTVREISNILSPEECQNIIEATSCSDESFTTPTAFLSESRDCQRIHTVDKTMSNIMMKRLRPFLPEVVKIDGVRWKLARFTHHWRYVRYYPGGHFSPHYDGVKMSAVPVPCMSVFTVQIYLNGSESFTGGSTRFYPDYEPDRTASHEIRYGHVSKFDPHSKKDRRMFCVEAMTGKALIFNHALNTLHDGSDVLTGRKFIMRGDILYTAIPEDIHLLPTVETICSDDALIQRHWCPSTALKHGTRNQIGEVWYCVCANDMHGATLEHVSTPQVCWHMDDDATISNNLTSNKEMSNSRVTTKLVILLSGKRAVGKDFIANEINRALIEQGFTVHRTALGNINKQLYAESANIDVDRLMNDREFKESHRVDMIKHHTQRNQVDPEWCLKQVINDARNFDVLLLSDIRTTADLQWFQNQNTALALLRINISDITRKQLGWEPCPVKDSLHTETELDMYHDWTACWDNSDVTEEGKTLLDEWIKLTVLPRIKDLLL